MKILCVCQYYYPEPFRITDICEELVKRGHEVTVVTGTPNYPMGEIYKGYRNSEKQDEVINGVKVHRCNIIPRKMGAIHRFLNYYSYAVSSTSYVSKIKEDYDVVFVNQLSPVMMANAGVKYKKKHNKKLVLYCLDLWPESLVAGGISRDSAIYKIFKGVSARVYKNADKILVTSKMFTNYLADTFGIAESKIDYLPQYAESIFSPEECRKEPDEYLDIMFAGNVGAAQSVETIIRAANEIKEDKHIRWHIVGDGSDLERCKALATELGLTSITFHGRKPLEEMPKYYAMADVMLVTLQKDDVLSLTLPGKVQTYMAAGKPIIGAIDGETRRVIEESGCGACCRAEDYKGLAKNVWEFEKKYKQESIKIKGITFYEKHFNPSNVFSFLEEIMKTVLTNSTKGIVRFTEDYVIKTPNCSKLEATKQLNNEIDIYKYIYEKTTFRMCPKMVSYEIDKNIKITRVVGETLSDMLNSKHLFEYSLEIGDQIAKTLVSFSSAGLIHNDFGPTNIIISRDNKAYLIDFGQSSMGTDIDSDIGYFLGRLVFKSFKSGFNRALQSRRVIIQRILKVSKDPRRVVLFFDKYFNYLVFHRNFPIYKKVMFGMMFPVAHLLLIMEAKECK